MYQPWCSKLRSRNPTFIFWARQFFFEINWPLGSSLQGENCFLNQPVLYKPCFVSRDPQVDPLLLKNVILKPYKGVIMDLSLSYGVEWPMTLTISNNAMELMEKSSGFLLEIELVKWKLNQLYKVKKDKFLFQFIYFLCPALWKKVFRNRLLSLNQNWNLI